MFKKCIEIFYKIRRHGIIKSFQIIIQHAINRLNYFLLCGIPWPLRPEFYYHLMKLIFVPNFKKKRILGIWDFKALPWSVGDPLVFIETLSILKIKHNAEEIDICVVYDRENPGGNRGKTDPNNNITSTNAQDYMIEFLPLFSTCPYLGSIYQFNSRKEFYRFLKYNSERYDFFPPLGQHLGETCNFYGGAPYLNEIQEFYDTYGYIPHLRIGDREWSWAQWFYLNHLPEAAVPVTISLKRTSHSTSRNSSPELWLSFIDNCKIEFPEVVFVIVGLREEVFEGLRKRSNVIIAKDFGTSIVEDLALIRTSLMYMGTSSGVNVIALFSDLPYLIFQFPVNVFPKYGLKPGENFSFATDRQKLFSTTTLVTERLLLNEFKELYSKLDRQNWRITALEKACNKHTHPTARVLDMKNKI